MAVHSDLLEVVGTSDGSWICHLHLERPKTRTIHDVLENAGEAEARRLGALRSEEQTIKSTWDRGNEPL